MISEFLTDSLLDKYFNSNEGQEKQSHAMPCITKQPLTLRYKKGMAVTMSSDSKYSIGYPTNNRNCYFLICLEESNKKTTTYCTPTEIRYQLLKRPLLPATELLFINK